MGFRQRGLTLAEVLVAFALLTIVVLTVIGVFLGGLGLMTRSQEMTDASGIGRQFLETVREQGGYTIVPDTPLTFDGSVPTPPSGSFPPPPYPGQTLNGREYTLKVECRPAGTNVRAVLVQVWWVDGGRVEFETAFHAAESE